MTPNTVLILTSIAVLCLFGALIFLSERVHKLERIMAHLRRESALRTANEAQAWASKGLPVDE
jgi:hypothetical protein